MTTYAPPDKIVPTFNPSDWQYAEDTVMTQALADERYLKLTGGNESGAVNFGSTIAVAGTSSFTGNSTFSNDISANTASFSGNVAFDTNVLYVDTVNNRVGVGTTSPSYPLDVKDTATTGSNNSIVASFFTPNIDTDGSSYLYLGKSLSSANSSCYFYRVKHGTNGFYSQGFYQGTQANIIGFNTGATRIYFPQSYGDHTYANTTGSQYCKFDSANFRLGVGTTSPSYTLDVAGVVNISSGNAYRIAGGSILSVNTLGSSVLNSSLTSVGTLTSLSVSGNTTLSSHLSGNTAECSSSLSVANTFAASKTLAGVQTTDAVFEVLSTTASPTYLLYADAPNGQIGVGTNSMTANTILDVSGNTKITGKLDVSSTVGIGSNYAVAHTGSAKVIVSGREFHGANTSGSVSFGYTFGGNPSVWLTINASGTASISVNTVTTTGFQWTQSGALAASASFYWMALG